NHTNNHTAHTGPTTATVAISSSTAAILLVTPVMPKPLSPRYGKSLPAANHSVLVARRARNRQNNHAGAPANATKIPDMISQAGTCRREDLGPVFCTTQPQKNTPRSVRGVPATISTVGPHPPTGPIDPRRPFSLESASRSMPKPQSLHIGISLSLVPKGTIQRAMVT